MYCSIEEAWPQFYNKQVIEKFTSKPKKIEVSASEYDEYVKFKNNKSTDIIPPVAPVIPVAPIAKACADKVEHFTNENTCSITLTHIQNCNHCMKEIYKRLNVHSKFDISTFINKENKDIITVVLIGLLMILIMNLCKN